METPKTKSTRTINIKGKTYQFCSLVDLPGSSVENLPFSIRILLENTIRNYDGFSITDEHIATLAQWSPAPVDKDIPYKPARILMQDFTGVPAVVDMASLRGEFVRHG